MSTQPDPVSESLATEEWERLALDEVFGALDVRSFDGDALVAECRTGVAVRRLLDDGGEIRRIMAVDLDQTMLDQARRRVGAESRRVFFNAQSVRALTFAPDVFELAICLNSLVTTADALNALSTFASLVRPGGKIALVVAGRGSFPLFRELLVEEALASRSQAAARALEEFFEMPVDEEAVRMSAERCDLEVIDIGTLDTQIDFGDPTAFAPHPVVAPFMPMWRNIGVSEDRPAGLADGALRRLETYFAGASLSDDFEVVWLVARVPEPELLGVDEEDVLSVED